MKNLAWLGVISVGLALLADVRSVQAQSANCVQGRSVEELRSEARCFAAAHQFGAAFLAAERLLALQPGDEEARALHRSLADALGRTDLAREDEGMKVADFGMQRLAWKTRFHVAALLGYDSNANAGTDATAMNLPLFRNLAFDIEEKLGDARRRASPVAGLGAAFATRGRLGEHTDFSVSGQAAARYNSSLSAYLPHDYWLDAEIARPFDTFRPALAVTALRRRVGQYGALDADRVTASLELAPMAGVRIVPFGGGARKRLPVLDGLALREQRYGLALAADAFPAWLMLYSGRERSRDARRHLDRDFTGAGLQWSHRLNARWRLELAFEETRSRYTEYSTLFLGHRADRFREARAALEHGLGNRWFVTPRLVLQENRSSVPLTEFRRSQLLLEVRREF